MNMRKRSLQKMKWAAFQLSCGIVWFRLEKPVSNPKIWLPRNIKRLEKVGHQFLLIVQEEMGKSDATLEKIYLAAKPRNPKPGQERLTVKRTYLVPYE
jgi:hypothetical protein